MNWKYLRETNENYKIFEDGTVERLEFSIIGKDGKTYKNKARIMSIQHGMKTGYKRVGFSPYGREYIHRLVAMHFLDLPENYRELDVNHIDGDKANNHYTNLEWCDRKYNMQHASKNNLINRHSLKRKKQAPINAKRGAAKNLAISREKRRLKYGKVAHYDENGLLIKIYDDINIPLDEAVYSYGQITEGCKTNKRKCSDKTYFRKYND